MLSQSFYKSNLSFLTQASQSKTKPQLLLPTTTITQKKLILQLLYLLLSMPGSILTKKSNSDQLQLPKKYQLSHLTSQTLNSSLKQAIKMCNQTKYVQSQTKKLYESTKNAVVKCFCEGVYYYLQEVKKYFAEVLSQVNCLDQFRAAFGKVTLLNFNNILEQRNYMLGFIIRCINSCMIQYEKKPQVVRLLDKIWQIQQQLQTYSQFTRHNFTNIAKRTLSPYFNLIKDWLSMIAIPQSQDFFIKQPQTTNTLTGKKKQLSQHFLHKNQQLQLNKLPKIIENQSYGILQIGKTIRFIRLYYEEYEKQKLMEYLGIQGEFRVLSEMFLCEEVVSFKRVKVQKPSLNQRLRNKNKNKLVSKQAVPDQNPYQMFTKLSNTFNIKWIQKIQIKKIQQKQKKQKGTQTQNFHGFLFYIKCLLIQILQNINKKCLQFFRNKNDTIVHQQKNRIQTSLTNRLIGIKKFMLLQQGDFLQQFFNAAEDIIDKQKSQVSNNRIYSCIDQAIENSSAKHLPKQILNNLHFDFIKQSDKRSQRLKVWVLFCFDYRQDNPINYIFHAEMMDKLKDICNFIFKLKKGQIVLNRLWNHDRELIKTDRNKLKVINKGKILRNSLNTFLNICLNFVINKIDVLWNQYIQEIKQAHTVFQIIQQSVQVILNLQKNSTHNNLLYNGTMMTLGLIQKFKKLHQMIRDQNLIVPVKEVDQLQFQLRGIVEIVMKIPELNQIVNYNSYFDKYE